jgi:hypothetical protein
MFNSRLFSGGVDLCAVFVNFCGVNILFIIGSNYQHGITELRVEKRCVLAQRYKDKIYVITIIKIIVKYSK